MSRTAATFLAITLVIGSVSVSAAEKDRSGQKPAPSVATAAADAWRRDAAPATSKGMTALFASYGVLSGLDMYSTIQARNNGAREVNPLLDTGYGQATATKALYSAATVLAVRAMAKKNKKAAAITMIVVNAVTAGVVINNFRNARR